LQSTASNASSPAGCPHSAAAATAAATQHEIKLVNVPKIPILGSMLHPKVQKIDLSQIYELWNKHWETFGDFYNIGLPGAGQGINGEVYVMTDPNEFMKVLRKEGTYPHGALEEHWPMGRYMKERGAAGGAGLFSNGPEWQRSRRFMQTDLLHPSAAKGYVPGIIRACRIASEGAPLYASNIGEYTTYGSFDMFSAVAFGDFPGLASGSTSSSQEENRKFCDHTITAVETEFPMMFNPLERIQVELGIRSRAYSKFHENFTKARHIGFAKLKAFKERKANGLLENDFEKYSYASLSIDRHLDSMDTADALTEEDVAEIIVVGLIAALDTTSAIVNWTLLHLAMNPTVQEELYKEVSENATNAGGQLTEDCFTKYNNVYLDAVLRENHRMTPAFPVNCVKENLGDDVEIHGTTIPKGSLFILESRALGMSPKYVENPDVFDPSRWLPDQVEQRKGTYKQALDHALYKQPFSAGARKCPGSRVANYEAKIFLSQLVLDWKISMKDRESTQSWRDIPYQQGLTVQPENPELVFERRK